MRSDLVPLESDDRATFGHVGNVVLVYVFDREAPTTFRLLEQHVRSVAARNGGKVGILMIVDHQKGPPPGFVEDARTLLDRSSSVVVGAAAALLTEGFVAAVYRSMGAMLLTLLGKRDLVGVHGSIEDAAAWILGRVPAGPHAPDAASLVAAGRAMRTPRARSAW